MNYYDLLKIAYCDNVSVLELTATLCIDAIHNEIPGDFAEAGVAFGAHGIVMNDVSKGQKVYLFDSFQGIPEHSINDIEWTQAHGNGGGNMRKSGGITVCKIETVQDTMKRFTPDLSNFFFVPGWFSDTLPLLTDEKFSVLRLDCDLYESYMLCFKYLLPRLSKGGWLIVDDCLSGADKAIIDSGLSLDAFGEENKIRYLKI